MELIQIIVLALVQGLTEFLPISSSAHLILVPRLVDWPDQGLAFDVAVHVGTLSAVVLYFRQEVQAMSVDWVVSLKTRQQTTNSRLAWAVLFGTIPAGLAGLAFKGFIEGNLRSPLVLAGTTVIFGLLLWAADVSGKRNRDETSIGWKDVLIIGCAQALALIPGTSRSGATMTAALFLGLSREAAARFSFLLSIPVIFLSGLLVVKDLVEQNAAVDWQALVWGTVLAGITAYLCIHFFLKLLEKIGMLPFVIYRLVLGAFLFYMFT
ncbi:MAG: undecaprenyl-diphosphate phosphatase [Gammaproteobacteria bacterium]|nr:undecaprenyl-diphosphate phosphatase [Gammaproteobacteria bacterium]MDH5801158.1 undecaprenyl-diphosphate phosphatase [Gammaproteobacteria bacterium]